MWLCNWTWLTHKNLKPCHCDNVNWPVGHQAKWNTSGTESETLQDLTHEKNLKADFSEVESRIEKAVCEQSIEVGNQENQMRSSFYTKKKKKKKLKMD
jgi:tRNA G10  N-methylase Trm11